MMDPKDDAARIELIREAIRFSAWAAGEGIAPVSGEPATDPGDFLVRYSEITGDDEWETVSERVAAWVAEVLP